MFWTPRPYQRATFRGLRAALDHPGETFTVMFPRQTGKNELSAMLLAFFLCERAAQGGTIVLCAPTATPQALISMQRVTRQLESVRPWLGSPFRVRPTGPNSLAVGRASIIFLSASPAAHVAGHTASIALVADEAQDIDPDWFNRQFRPMAAATAAPTFMFGTAWDGHSLLERAVARNRKLDRELPLAIPRHYQVSWREAAAWNPLYGAYVESERERLGPGNPLFLSQYELLPARNAGRLLDERQLAGLAGEHPRLRGPIAGERYVAGLDFGGEGEGADPSALAIARVAGHRTEVVDLRAWQSATFAALLEEVTAIARSWRLERICIDATGLGAPLAKGLETELGPCIEPVVFNAGSKSTLGFDLLAAANTRTLALFADDRSAESAALRLQLRRCRATYHPGGRLQWGDTTAHDDHAIALALCLRAASLAGPPRVAVGRARG